MSVNPLLVHVEVVEGHLTEGRASIGLLFVPCLGRVTRRLRLTRGLSDSDSALALLFDLASGMVGNVSDDLKQAESLVDLTFCRQICCVNYRLS